MEPHWLRNWPPMGHEVVGVDGNGLHVDSVKDRMAASFVLDATDEMALSVLPLKSVDAVIVAIGDNFGASVRIVSLLKKLKVKRIYARAVERYTRVYSKPSR